MLVKGSFSIDVTLSEEKDIAKVTIHCQRKGSKNVSDVSYGWPRISIYKRQT